MNKFIFLFLLILYQFMLVHLTDNFVVGDEVQANIPRTETLNDENKSKNIKIAIIGAGIGGTSLAYFLNELLKNKLKDYEIHIFEKNERIGGRLATIDIEGNSYESGGSIIHERNRYAQNYAKKFGLKRREDFIKEQKSCIMNGTEMVFCESDYEYIDIIKGAWRYGFDMLSMKRQVTNILNDFDKIYKFQKNQVSFDNVHDLLYSMNPKFVEFTKEIYSSLAQSQGYNHYFINEILQSITLVNYGQSVSIPAFVGFVSFAGAGADLWSVEGGNKRLAEKFYENSNSIIRKQTYVRSITALSNNKFSISFQGPEIKNEEVFDYVILAFPITAKSDIELINIDFHDKLSPNNYDMHLTKVTFVKGIPLPQYENFSFFSCNVNNFITSLSEILPVHENMAKTTSKKSRIFKIFSGKHLNYDHLKHIFSDYHVINSVDWYAYPEYSLNYTLPSFKITDGLYYLNAIEWSASAMEMSMIGAKNVALIVCQKLSICKPVQQTTFSIPKSDL